MGGHLLNLQLRWVRTAALSADLETRKPSGRLQVRKMAADPVLAAGVEQEGRGGAVLLAASVGARGSAGMGEDWKAGTKKGGGSEKGVRGCCSGGQKGGQDSSTTMPLGQTSSAVLLLTVLWSMGPSRLQQALSGLLVDETDPYSDNGG